MSLVLLYPPCAMPDRPYISLAVLMPFLASRGIKAFALDVNIEFFRMFLSEKHLGRVCEHARTRMAALNARIESSDAEKQEARHLAKVIELLEGKEIKEQIARLFDDPQIGNAERLNRFRKALRLASLPYYPERIDFTRNTDYVRYFSNFSRFSSQDICESLRQGSLFAAFFEELLPSYLRNKTPDIVGISVTFPDQIIPAFHCAKSIKTLLPCAHITLGGASISSHFREVANPELFQYVDSFILDEGEVPLMMLANAIERAPQSPDLSAIPGLIYLAPHGIVKNAPAPPLDLDTSFQVDYSIFPLDRYLMPRSKMSLLFRLSKGCYWGKCAFCKLDLSFIKHHHQPETGVLYASLTSMLHATGVPVVHFSDDSASPEVLEELSKRILAEGVSFQWATNLRIDRRLTLSRLILFKQAGCRSLSFGVESYNNRILQVMRKGITTQLIEQILTDVSWVGIPVSLYMIVGFPGETADEARQSFEKIREFIATGLIRTCIYNVFEIAPFSAIHAHPDAFGIEAVAAETHKDLFPPVTNFSSGGMSRDEAQALCLEFIQELERIHPDSDEGRHACA